MSARAIRRAAERQALKLVSQANLSSVAQPEIPSMESTTGAAAAPAPENPAVCSEARLAANRANAQHSTGPRTEEGKAKSSMNAVKTGLTGITILLPTDDALAYQQHLDRHFREFSPATDKEKAFVQTIADTEWRLLRIAPLEAGIYAVGRRKLADLFPEEKNPATREDLITAEIFMTYRKDFSNLALQERRLRNQRQAYVAELRELQKERLEKQQQDLTRAAALYKDAQKRALPFHPAFFGFVFSTDEIAAHIAHEQAKNFAAGGSSELNAEQFTAYFAQWRSRQAA
jgi:hypothetical protein